MAEKFYRDIWGRTHLDPGYNTVPQKPYEIDSPASGDGVTYIRYENKDTCAIHRVTVATSNGRKTTKIEIAYGAWADRATLEYEPAANYPKEVEA